MAQDSTLSSADLASLGIAPAAPAAPAPSAAAPGAAPAPAPAPSLSGADLASLGVAPPAPPAAGPTKSPEEFVRQYLPAAQRVSQQTGVSPELLLGQWGLETGWGKSIVPGTNNLGNIKDFSGGGVAARDNMTGSNDRYRQYGSVDEFGDNFTALLNKGRYNAALNSGSDAQKYFGALRAGGYAEDPNYVASGTAAASRVAALLKSQGINPATASPAAVQQASQQINWGGNFKGAQPEVPRTWGEAAKDTGLSVLKGIAGLGKSGGDLYGAATGDMDNWFSTTGQRAQENIGKLQSPQIQEKNAQLNADIDAADGITGKAAAAVKAVLTDPALAVDTIASNLATVLPGAVVGRAAGAVVGARAMIAAMEAGPVSIAARQAIAQSASKWAVGGAKVAAAIQQGADVASGAYDDALKKTPEQWAQNPDFMAATNGGTQNVDEVKHALALKAARAALPAAAVISVGANSIPGLHSDAIERAIVGGAARVVGGKTGAVGFGARMGKAAFGEGVGEALEEGGGQYAANVANQQYVDPNQDLTQEVGKNAGMGAAGGILMGAGAGGFHQSHDAHAPHDPVADAHAALAPVAAAAEAGDSPLSRAAMAGNTPEAIASQLGQQQAAQAQQEAANAPKADPMANDVASLVQAAKQPGTLDKLRSPDSPVNAATFVSDMATAQSPSASPAVREKSVARMRTALEWAGEQPDIARPAAVDPATGQPIAQDAPAQNADTAAPGLPGDVNTGAVPRSNPTTPVQRRDAVDRDAELQGQTNAAGTQFDRDNAQAQAQLNRERGLGANPTPAPAAPAPAPRATQEDLDRVSAASQQGQRLQARAADAPRQEVINKAMRSIEERGGVASPAEAKILQEANLGKPYDRIDESLSPELSTDQKLTQATGIALDKAPRESTRYSAAEPAVDGTEAEREAARQRSGSGSVDVSERAGPKPGSVANPTPAAPRVNAVITALRTPGNQRSAEQVATINAARARLSPADMAVVQKEAVRAFDMTAQEKAALRTLRENESSRSVPRETEARNDSSNPAQPAAVEPQTAVARKRKAHLRQLVANGFSKVERRDDGFHLTGRAGDIKLEGIADAALARAAIHESIHEGANEANTSPTDAQKEANNYRLGRVEFDGMKLGIENPIGSERSGTAPDGTKWSVSMTAHYGDVTGTKGADGDALDVYLVHNPRHGSPVFVVDQYGDDGKFDETKSVMGVATAEEAQKVYDAHFSDGSGPRRRGYVTQMTVEQFKDWANSKAALGPASGEMRNGASVVAKPDAAPARSVRVNFGGTVRELRLVDQSELSDSADRDGKSVRVSKVKAKIIDAIGNIFGKQVEFYEGTREDGDGFILNNNPSKIFLNRSGSIDPVAVFGHELLHALKRDNPKIAEALEAAVQKNLKDGALEHQQKLGYAAENALEEITSDLGGDLMSDPTFWQDVFNEVQARTSSKAEAKSMLAQLADWVYRAVAKIADASRLYGAMKMVNDADAVRTAFKDALASHIEASSIGKQAMQAEITRANNRAKQSLARQQKETEAFKSWFGESKVVDSTGAPQVMYTGTSKDVDFKAFKIPKNGAWFSSVNVANEYAQSNDSQGAKYNPDTRNYEHQNTAGRVMPVYLRIEKPYVLSKDEREQMRVAVNYKRVQGQIFDSVRARGYDGVDLGHGTWVVIGEPSQVKSAIGNNGSFDASKTDITRSVQRDMFPDEVADKNTTVQQLRVKSSKGPESVDLGNVNSEGRQITATKQGLDNFHKWFDESEATDDDGKPLVLYHSTNGDIGKFEIGRETTNNFGLLGDVTTKRGAIFMTPDREMSQEYLRSSNGQNVMPVYASLQSPIDLRGGITESLESELEGAGISARWLHNLQNTWEAFDLNDDGSNAFIDGLKKLGYDGAIFNEDSRDQEGKSFTTYAAFSPEQVKSATGNIGTFNESSDITRSAARESDALDALPAVSNAKIDSLTSAAQRGARELGKRTSLSADEKTAVAHSAETTGLSVKEITDQVRQHKLANPPAQGWAPLEFNRVVMDDKGKPTYDYKKVPYTFAADKEGKTLKVDTPEYKRRVNAAAKGMADEVRKVFERAESGDKNAENILAQAGWYKAMRGRLRHEFGGLGDLFADLLGATSPNTPVRDNWTNAVDSLRRASRGDFDTLIPAWESWSKGIDEAETGLRSWFNQQLATGASKKAIKADPEYKRQLDALAEARKLPDSLLPTKESGKKYGFNGRNVARAMVDMWRTVRDADPDIGRGGTAPKAVNFSGNLIGFRERATIDVWAARMLQRLSGGERIPSMAENGVSGEMRANGDTTLQFGIGQDIFSEAVKRIRADEAMKTDPTLAKINDDDLQAVVWFVEKELWTVNDWTNAAGEGGSFELEASLTGSADQARIRELRRVVDSSKSTTEAKATARTELAQLERTVDRYVGGLSIQQSAGTQGVDMVPQNADMARLGATITNAIYESDDGTTVLASKALPTEGRYGGVERSLDLEVVAREGYNPNPLWRTMLEQAQATNQDSTFLSRVLRDGEEFDPLVHRPGMEIYFQEAATGEKMQAMLGKLADEGVQFLTVITDGRRMPGYVDGEMPPAVGVRVLYVPEFDQRYGDNLLDLNDLDLRSKIKSKADELGDIAARITADMDGVSYAGQFWYESQVAFANQYKEKIDGLASGQSEGTSGSTGAPAWRGQSVREGLEGADRQAREAAGRQPGEQLLGGGAIDADARPVGRKRRSARGAAASGLPDAGSVRGSDGGLAESSRSTARPEGREEGLIGLPTRVNVPGVGAIEAGPFLPARDVAERYMAKQDMEYSPPTTYARVDRERAMRIAGAYDAMKHDPKNPEVKAAYAAMIKETTAQYEALLESGLKVEFISGADPYAASPRLMTEDVRNNNHMWVYGTRDAFGSNAEFDVTDNPLLAETAHEISGVPALANDLFRVVHDYFGHVKEGVGFRPDGEENAWRSHAAMYSPEARRALTTETRGQNSWVNFGPHGERNQRADAANTIFADQKVNLLPQWVVDDGREDDGMQKASPDRFMRSLRAAKKESPRGYAVLDRYSDKDLKAMQLFLSPDGLSGYALKGDEIVSAFSHPTAPRGRLQQIMQSAIENGGRRLDVFDTGLAKQYEKIGFREVRRGPWMEEYRPDDWPASAGTPDTIFMELGDGATDEASQSIHRDKDPVVESTAKDSTGEEFSLKVSRGFVGFNRDTEQILVEARSADGNRRGMVDFGVKDDGTLIAEMARVAGPYQRRGIATMMYEAAIKAGYKIEAGRKQTEDGNGMVKALQKKGLIAEGETRPITDADRANQSVDRSNQPVFYSQLEKVFKEVPQRLSTQAAPQWKLWLDANAGKLGVKKEEIEWSGVTDYLKTRGKDKVTSAELADYMANNGVKVEETTLGHTPDDGSNPRLALSQAYEQAIEESDAAGGAVNPGYIETLDPADRKPEEQRLLDAYKASNSQDMLEFSPHSSAPPAKYETYTVPGGENYREVLLTVPELGPKPKLERMNKEPDDVNQEDWDAAHEANERGAPSIMPDAYKSSHWEQRNIVAHLRVDDRIDSDGKKVLFVNEVQSDWGQDGKKKGFQKDVLSKEDQVKLLDEAWRLKDSIKQRSDADRAAGLEQISDETLAANKKESLRISEIMRTIEGNKEDEVKNIGRLQPAPFVTDTKSWSALAIKRALVMAAQGGYDKVAFINGKQAADLYSLGRQVREIQYKVTGDQNYKILVIEKNGRHMSVPPTLDAEGLEQYVGKEMAKQIVEKATDKPQRFQGLDLEIGGEGMKTFYDQIIPQVLRDVAKKVGGKVEEVRVDNGDTAGEKKWTVQFESGETHNSSWTDRRVAEQIAKPEYGDKVIQAGETGSKQIGITITPKMKEQLQSGAAMFSKERTTGDSGRQYTPEQMEMFRNTGRTTEPESLKARLMEARKGIGAKIAQGVVDQFRPLKDLGGDGYTLARLSKGAAGAFEAMLHHGKLNIEGGAYNADQSGGFIERVGNPLGAELEDFMQWVASNRAEQLTKEDREHLFTAADIAAGKSLADGQLSRPYTKLDGSTTTSRQEAYNDSLKKFNEFNKNAMDMAEQSGLIDPEARKIWESEFYVPFYRVSEEDGAFMGSKIKGGIARQQAFKKLKGGKDKLNSDLLANTLQNWAHLIDAAAKNRAAKATLEAAENMGVAVSASEDAVRDMAKSTGNKNGVVWFMDGGKQRHFLVEDKMVLAAINSLEYAGMKGPLMNALSSMKHWLTVGVTASPAFKIRNLIRDTISAIGISGLSYNPVKNLMDGYKASEKDSQEYVSALASGGLIRFGTMIDGNATDRIRTLVKRGVHESTILSNPEKVKAFYDKFVDPAIQAYHEIGNRGEEINRSALYSQLRKQGKSHAEASLMARDLMDFSMQGTWSSIRFLTQVVPFMNARLQGLYKLGKAAKDDPKRFAVVSGAVALASVALQAAFGDDDDWKKREDFDRDGFWWFKLGGTAFRIPKPFEIGAIGTIAERGVQLFTDKDFTAARFRDRLLHIASDNLSMNPIPQAVKPLLDVYANKDSFSGRPIEGEAMQKLKSEYRYSTSTSMVARAASTALNTVTGTVGAEALSPVQIDAMLQGYFGWLGTFVVGGADMALRPLTNEPSRPAADVMKVVSQGFLRTLPEPSSKYVSAVYEQATILEHAYQTERQLRKEGKISEADQFKLDHAIELQKYKKVEGVKASIGKDNKAIREIQNGNASPTDKRDRIQVLRDKSSETAKAIY